MRGVEGVLVVKVRKGWGEGKKGWISYYTKRVGIREKTY